MRAFPLAGFLYYAVALYLSHGLLLPIECRPPPRGFIAGPKLKPEARRTLESTFQSGVLRLIGGCGGSSVEMGPRRDVSHAEGVVLVKTLGAVRAGRWCEPLILLTSLGPTKLILVS